MKHFLETITISHPGQGSGVPANVTVTMTLVCETSIPLHKSSFSNIEEYECIPSDSGKIEIFRNIIQI
jgi:hypothetical protein